MANVNYTRLIMDRLPEPEDVQEGEGFVEGAAAGKYPSHSYRKVVFRPLTAFEYLTQETPFAADCHESSVTRLDYKIRITRVGGHAQGRLLAKPGPHSRDPGFFMLAEWNGPADVSRDEIARQLYGAAFGERP